MFKFSEPTLLSLEEILQQIPQELILNYYLGIKKIPCVINSPLREDNNPSFSLYWYNNKILFRDLATRDKGDIFTLLTSLWRCSFKEMLKKLNKDFNNFDYSNKKYKITRSKIKSNSTKTTIKCKTRDWESYDLEYWKSFGISKKWLEFANIYPISYKIIEKNNCRLNFICDKYAYAFVEFKENKTTLKIYQPFNTKGFKWSNSHDSSVISLWTKVPEYGEKICICSSLKDALCLWANTGIPSIAIQGEGYNLSNTAINQLKSRFTHIYILLDNDKAGLLDGEKLANLTGFTNLVLPKINNSKDISDLFKSLDNKNQFKQIINNIFTN